MLYVVVVVNNEGGEPATLHESLDSVRAWIRTHFAESDPPLTPDEFERADRDLANLTGECVEVVHSSDAWKEWIYVAPIGEKIGTFEAPELRLRLPMSKITAD